MRPSASPPTKALRKRSLRMTSRREGDSFAHKPAKKVAAKPKPGTKPNAPPPAAPAEPPGGAPPRERPAADRPKEVPRRRPRFPFTPLPCPRSLKEDLAGAKPAQPPGDLQRLQVRRRPRTCLRQSARQESQAPKRRARLLRTGLLHPRCSALLSGLQCREFPHTTGTICFGSSAHSKL